MIKNFRTPIPRFSVISFLLALLLFGMVIGKDRMLQANASRETFAVLASDAEKARNEYEQYLNIYEGKDGAIRVQEKLLVLENQFKLIQRHNPQQHLHGFLMC